MKLVALLVTAASVAYAQDAGVMRARPVSVDAGTPLAESKAVTPQPQVQTVVIDRTAEVNGLKEEVRSLQSEAKQTNARLDSTVSELQQVRQQMTEQQKAVQAQQQRREAQRSAAVSLGTIDQQLATGDTAIEGTLSQVQENLGPSAKANLEYARQAIQNNDLTTARQYLSAAAADAAAGR
ncbi:MAG: hypothetical protein IPJ65_01145 [Archangiaceae bacterium]|nr:hypothetical protein [Archangiaceae bacterium]